MRNESITLIGQAGWVKSLAEGLSNTGLRVEVAPINTARTALDPRTWLRLRSADVVVRIGFRPGARTWRGRAFDLALRLAAGPAKTACYWIGTDVLRFTEDLESGKVSAGWRTPALGVDHHLSGSAPLKSELEANGIASSLLDFPWRTVEVSDPPPPLPDQFTVLTYLPDSRPDFYGGPTILAAAKALPEISFLVMGGTGAWVAEVPPNVHFLGWLNDPSDAFKRATCVVRIAEHDSIGGTAVEGLLFGRTVLYTQALKHTRRITGDADSLAVALAEALDEWKAGSLGVDLAAAGWARKEFDHVARFTRLADALCGIAHSPRQPRMSYLTLQATTEGQAAHAHVHEIVKGLAVLGWSSRVLKPHYRQASPGVATRLGQFALIQLRSILAFKHSDALYVRSHFAAFPSAFMARSLNVPVVQEVNGPHDDAVVAWPLLRWIRGLLSAVNRLQFRTADAVITVTPQLVSWLRRDAGVDRGHLVSNGADIDLFTPGSQRPHGLPQKFVVFFGALAPWQGVEVALNATACSQWPDDVALVIVGDGRARDVVQQRADGERIVYLGRRPYAEIPGIVSNAMASLLPKLPDSHTESGLAPLKLFESMACGVPVIASDLPGMADTINEAECGLLVEPSSADELALAVAHIAANPQEGAAMGARGRANAVAHHSWLSRAEDTANVLASAMRFVQSRRNGPRPRGRLRVK